ncbi:MAG TPA: DciA family protein, partial [Gammaproteobacteria bacterium]|nr:DciA family protein [Gammaproteobacteria bacterium]
EQVRRKLPPELAPWCLGAEIRDRSLVLYMASAATATALRYRQQALLSALADELDPPCTRLTVRVMPDPPLPPTPRPTPRLLPEAIRRLLEQTAEGIGDTALACSLRRLAGSKSTPRK